MQLSIHLAFLASLVSLVGCSIPPEKMLPADVFDVMQNADDYELFALEPAKNQKPGEALFRGFAVRGKCPVAIKKDRDWITANIERGLVDVPKPRKFQWPQVYGVRARSGDRVVELLFEFDECKVTAFWKDTSRVYPTSDHPWWLIQRTLFDSGVPHPQ